MNNALEVLRADFPEEGTQAYRIGGRIEPGYDGSGSLFLNNPFGAPAKEYLRFESPDGIDLTRDSFSLLFWCRTLYGGSTEWADKTRQAQPGTGVRIDQAKGGGTLFSTMDLPEDASGIAAVMLPQHVYLAAGIVDNGKHYDADGIWEAQDGRWHQLALLFDREGSCRIYVDDVLRSAVDISAAAGRAIGSNTLTFGADQSGKFGIGGTYFQHIRLYRGLLEETEVKAFFRTQQLQGLIYESAQRMEHLGREYTEAMKVPLRTAIAEARKGEENAYERLRDAYEAFLSAPQGNARFTAALLGDPHIARPGDTCSQAVETLVADTLSSGIRADVLLSVGDNGNDSSYETGRNAFRVFGSLSERYAPQWQLAACHGNHDTMYNDERENYREGTRAYWEGMREFLTGKYRQPGTVLDEAYHDVAGQYLGAFADHAGFSYGVTVRGVHILVLNTDYFDQTGSSKLLWSLEGNKLDPIRHGAMFHEGTFTWIKHMLETYSRDDIPIFVLCHFPFIDSTPLSYYREINIEDNSIGRQDARIRALLSRYNVFYICGHLHSGLGLSGPVDVVSPETGCSFPEITISSMHTVARAYRVVPAGWHLFLYEDEIVLRARDYAAHQWLTAYDEIIPLKNRAGT